MKIYTKAFPYIMEERNNTQLASMQVPSSTTMPVFDVKITILEALKPLMTRSFTNSGLAINI